MQVARVTQQVSIESCLQAVTKMLKWQRVYSYPFRIGVDFQQCLFSEVLYVEVEYTLFIVIFTDIFVWSFMKETEDNNL